MATTSVSETLFRVHQLSKDRAEAAKTLAETANEFKVACDELLSIIPKGECLYRGDRVFANDGSGQLQIFEKRETWSLQEYEPPVDVVPPVAVAVDEDAEVIF